MSEQDNLPGMSDAEVGRLELTPKVDGYAVSEGALSLSGAVGLFAYQELDRELVGRILEPEDPRLLELAKRWGEGAKPARTFTLLVKAHKPQVTYKRVYDRAGRDVGRELAVKLTTIQLLDDQGLGALVDEKTRLLEAFSMEIQRIRRELMEKADSKLMPTWPILLEQVGYLWETVQGFAGPVAPPMQGYDPETGEVRE